MIPSNVQKELEKKSYALVGKNSAVQICNWTKNSLRNEGECWKEKFYGIKSHKCCQFSPSVMWCENSCLHCWRPIELNLGINLKEVDKPEKIIDKIIEERKKLLIGFGGNKNVDKKKLEDSFVPSLFTFSLSGEATLYPHLGEMIKNLRNRGIITFLVTNGQNPKVIERLAKDNELPTQLTLSLNAPNEKLFNIWHNSLRKDAWKRFNQTISLFKKLKGKTRRCLRLTLVKKIEGKGKLDNITNTEEKNVREYVQMIKKAEPDFIHVKGFTSIGNARERMGYEKQPFHSEVKIYAKKILQELNKQEKSKNKKKYRVLAEEERSAVVVLGKDKKMMKIRKA